MFTDKQLDIAREALTQIKKLARETGMDHAVVAQTLFFAKTQTTKSTAPTPAPEKEKV